MATGKTLKKQGIQNILIYIATAVIVLYIASIAFESEPAEISCKESPCEECGVVAVCIELIETADSTSIGFDLVNQNTVSGNCSAKVSLSDANKSVIKYVYFGVIQPGESERRETAADFAPHSTNFSIAPFCDWNE